VTDAILRTQRAILQAAHGAADSGCVDPQAVLGAKPSFPGSPPRQLEQVVFVLDWAMGHLHEDASAEPAVQVCAHDTGPVSGEAAPAAAGTYLIESQLVQLVRQCLFQP